VEDSAGHRDPAIEGFLSLLETDIRSGQNLTSLPQALERSMMNASKRQVDLDDEIEGDVSL
jgi:antitoxin PrlF